MPLNILGPRADSETMTTPLDPEGAERSPSSEPAERSIPILALIAAVVAIVIAVIALVLVIGNDGDDVETVDTTTTLETTTTVETTTTESTTTTEPTTTESTTTIEATTTTADIDPEAYRTAVWPWFEAASGPGAERYQDPIDAATAFATEFVGFTDPVVGEYMAGDSRSGEIEIRNRADGPATTVFVRQLGPDDTWWVLGAVTENIEIVSPEALGVLGAEMVVEGQARTFEGNVEVILRADGRSDPILVEAVTGRGDGTFGPFDETFPIDPGTAKNGAAVFLSRSAEDGSVWEAVVVRVYFVE